MFIKLMMSHEPVLDVEVLEKCAGGPRVFGEDDVGFFQDADGAEGHILQITDRSGYKI